MTLLTAKSHRLLGVHPRLLICTRHLAMAANVVAACLVPVTVLAFFYLVLFPNDFTQLQSALSNKLATEASPNSTEPKAAAAAAVDFRVFFGIITRADSYERRALLRMAYALQPRPRRAVIDVRFVMCRLDKEEDAVLVSLEIITHNDVLVLNCTENMNDGKTYDYFSTLPRLFRGAEAYDYAGKIDDDTYYRLDALADTLRPKARRDMWHGFLNPCHIDPKWQYMSGMGYIVSWDVAEWVAATPELRELGKGGHEDEGFGLWLRKGGKGKNKYGEEPRMYDYLDREMYEDVNCFRHELVTDTVAVHKLKDRLKWARTLRFFNATNGLKPSKMYTKKKQLFSLFFLLPFILLAIIYFLIFPNEFRLQSSLATSPTAAADTAATAKAAPDIRVLLGVLTRADKYERRALVRLAYALQPRPARAVVHVRFVVCNLTKEEDAALVSLEIAAYGDVIVLNCTENMDNGKTHTYFSSLPSLFPGEPYYDYVGKTDDDTYYRLASLADTLRDKPRRDAYYGFLTPCHAADTEKTPQYMSGMGYVVSWDVAAWVAATPELRNDLNGPEDLVFGRWLRWGGRGRNVYGSEPRMYDYLDGEMKEKPNCFRHLLQVDTVAVHKLKDNLKWARTLRFFNATQGHERSPLFRCAPINHEPSITS
uniref:Hexosyltransferase n=1 Tax=Leersia perrieri TaxID=77586 RepID=A0A0D9VLX2_9ORYZ